MLTYQYRLHVIAAHEIRDHLLKAALSMVWCDVTGSKLFIQYRMHVQLLSHRGSEDRMAVSIHRQSNYLLQILSAATVVMTVTRGKVRQRAKP